MLYKLDAVDAHILKLLQLNARITNQQLANEIGLSPAATLERVKKLEAFEVICSYRAVVSEEKIGLYCKVLVYIKLEDVKEETLQKFEQAITSHPEIVEAYQLIGAYDAVLVVSLPTTSDYVAFISRLLSTLPSVKNIESTLILKNLKSWSGLPISS